MPNPEPIRIEDLVAINREIAALIRARIPLELGLKTFAFNLPSRLGRLAGRIAEHLSRGESPSTAFQLEAAPHFPVYAAVIDAGLESGRLPDVLEAVASSAEIVEDTRRNVQLGLIYPAIVCVLGYLLLLFLVGIAIPRYLASAAEFGFEHDVVFEVMRTVYATSDVWWWGIPLATVAVIVLLRLIRPGLRFSSLHQLLQRAKFAELLQIQIEHGLPLVPSLQRAAAGSGDSRLETMAHRLSEDLTSGTPFSKAIAQARELPPMMRWMIATGAEQGSLVRSLGLLRDSFYRRALRRSYLAKTWIPAAVTIVVGGGFALTYGVLCFIPLRAFWIGLMHE